MTVWIFAEFVGINFTVYFQLATTCRNRSLLERSLLSPVFEILRSNRIEVTSLTFQGHVTI